MVQTKLNRSTSFNVPKRLDQQLQSLNDNQLQIRSFASDAQAPLGFAGWWCFLIIFSPLVFLFTKDLVFSTLEFMDGVHFNQDKLLGEFVIVPMIILFMVFMGPGFSYLMARMIKKDSPTIFDRESQKVSMVASGVIFEGEWHNIRGRIKNLTTLSGAVPLQDTIIALDLKPVRNLNSKPLTPQQKKMRRAAVIEGSFTADGYDGCEMAWEFIREFMENGPEGLDIPKRLYYPLSSKTTRTSISFREAVSYHWPFPPYRENEPTTLQVIKTILVPVRLAFYIPNVLADGCWHWMMNWGKPKMLLPEQEKAQQQAITPDMVFDILGKDKEFMPYPEAKAKLYP